MIPGTARSAGNTDMEINLVLLSGLHMIYNQQADETLCIPPPLRARGGMIVL